MPYRGAQLKQGSKLPESAVAVLLQAASVPNPQTHLVRDEFARAVYKDAIETREIFSQSLQAVSLVSGG
jgi:hypothetical protein